jgi:hypothetical protein
LLAFRFAHLHTSKVNHSFAILVTLNALPFLQR